MAELQTPGVGSFQTGDTRGTFLRKAAAVSGAALIGGGLLAARPDAAFAGHSDSVADVDVLNFALTLEYLEASFYTQALGGPGTTGVKSSKAKFDRRAIERSQRSHGRRGRHNHGHGDDGDNDGDDGYAHGGQSSIYNRLRAIRNHEVAHVDFLRTALASAAVAPCTFDFSGSLKNVRTFLGTAQVLENTGVMAYDGAIRYIDTGDYLQAGAQIATIEARHAAYLNMINGDSPFPDAFDMGKKPSEIIAAITPFVVTCPKAVTDLFKRLP